MGATRTTSKRWPRCSFTPAVQGRARAPLQDQRPQPRVGRQGSRPDRDPLRQRIERSYNLHRRHTALGNLSPMSHALAWRVRKQRTQSNHLRNPGMLSGRSGALGGQVKNRPCGGLAVRHPTGPRK
jgi:hypothetical protein